MDRGQNEKNVERKVTEILEEGKLNSPQPEKLALDRLVPKYEIRQIVQLDPIVEETKLFRGMAEEVDDRYDQYMEQAQAAQKARNKNDEQNT